MIWIGNSNTNLIKKYIELTDCTPLINVIIYTFNDIIVFFSKYEWCYGFTHHNFYAIIWYYNKAILSCSGSIWAIKLHWLDKCLLYTFTDQDIVFSVINWFMLNNGKKDNSTSISRTSQRTSSKMMSMAFVFAHFRLFGNCFGHFNIEK